MGLVSAKKVRVCSYALQGSTTSTATTLKFVYGTGSNCASGTTAITPTFNFPASSTSLPFGQGAGLGEVFQTAASNELCATNSAAGTVNIFIAYTQY